MYPIHTHFIKYKNKYLGKNNAVFGFIKEGHAKRVVEKIKYVTPIVKVSPSTYVLNRRPHPPKNVLKTNIDRNALSIETFETSVGIFFASINNMELKLIDQVLVDRFTDTIILKSEFSMDEMVPLEPFDLVQHLENVLNHEPVDYEYEMSRIILDRYIVENEDDMFE